MPITCRRCMAEKIQGLLDEAGVTKERELAAEMVQAVLKLARDEPGRGEMKLMVRSYKELRYAFKIFKPYRQRRKVSVFGSARTPGRGSMPFAFQVGAPGVRARADRMQALLDEFGLAFLDHEHGALAFAEAEHFAFDQRVGDVENVDRELALPERIREPERPQRLDKGVVQPALDDEAGIRPPRPSKILFSRCFSMNRTAAGRRSSIFSRSCKEFAGGKTMRPALRCGAFRVPPGPIPHAHYPWPRKFP